MISTRAICIAMLILGICLINGFAWADDDAIMDVDDIGMSTTGSWTQSSWAPCAVGGSYKYAWGSDDSITFQTHQTADITGMYMVYARYTSHANRANNARYRIYDGSTYRATAYVNQETNGCNWVYLASVTLTSGNNGRVVLDNTGETADEATIADAVRFVRVSKDEADIVDEPGIDYTISSSLVDITSTSYQVVLTESLTCPGGGYVLATATGIAQMFITSPPDWEILTFSLSETGSADDNRIARLAGREASSQGRESSITLQDVKTCNKGETITYKLYAKRSSGCTGRINYPTLTVLYFPVTY